MATLYSYCIIMKFSNVINTAATRRRTIRKVKPEKKIDLIAKYRDSDESMYVEKQTADGKIATKSGRPRRWFRYLKYHFKLIPYYIYSFFWQVYIYNMCYCVTLSKSKSVL